MGTAVVKMETESLTARMSACLDALERMPKQSSAQDCAAALSQLQDAEKLLRKLRVAWTACLVMHAKQASL